jgi:hypothetical protein
MRSRRSRGRNRGLEAKQTMKSVGQKDAEELGQEIAVHNGDNGRLAEESWRQKSVGRILGSKTDRAIDMI